MQTIHTIDSHTGGEPTRVVITGGPDLGCGTFQQRFHRLTTEFDAFRSAVVNEPRGSEALVGALLCEPSDTSCDIGVMFFNNRGFLGMCGHGTIGVMVTLRHLGRLESGSRRIETPVGVVAAEVFDDGEVAVENVPSYRLHKSVSVETPSLGTVTGDVAYGGNWFYLVGQEMGNLAISRSKELIERAWEVRRSLEHGGITGADGAEIDHIEFFSSPEDDENDSRNFVLCPGGAFDRSPCGTGTSAKLACLAADGKLAAGEVWRQESLIGSVFACSYRPAEEPDKIIPTIRGKAFVTSETKLVLDPDDPFCMGIRPW